MKIFKSSILTAGLLLCAGAAQAALTAGSVAVLDGSGNSRETFTNAERITLRQAVYNSAASTNTLSFIFRIYNPSGGAVFSQAGNSVMNPLPGNSYSTFGLGIAQFYSVPGVYKFRGEATLNGSTVVQEKTFQISSPNINLIYPPNGASGLSDNPVTLRWVASGASTYKVTLAEDAGLSLKTHSGTTSSSMYSYPDNPSGTLGTLVAGTQYYWKVEGLDAVGNEIAESTVYRFSLKSGGATKFTCGYNTTQINIATNSFMTDKIAST